MKLAETIMKTEASKGTRVAVPRTSSRWSPRTSLLGFL